MYIKKLEENKEITVAVPLTTTSGKTRVKKRSILNEYGIPVATCQNNLTNSCYIEWQIGYDVVVAETDKLSLTTLGDIRFMGANGKEKAFYELSEYIYYLAKWGIVSHKSLSDIKNMIVNIPSSQLFDNHTELSIKRSHFIEKEFNNLPFLFTRVEYPLIVYKFGKYEIIAEIMIREKQRAIGVMPMLYLCFPITELKTDFPLLGRRARSKEHGDFIIDKDNTNVFLELLKLFGMLSENHRNDMISIIDVIIRNNK